MVPSPSLTASGASHQQADTREIRALLNEERGQRLLRAEQEPAGCCRSLTGALEPDV